MRSSPRRKKALYWVLAGLLAAALLVYAGYPLLRPEYFYSSLIRAVTRSLSKHERVGAHVALDFDGTAIAEKEAVQEKICRNLTPLSVRYSDGTSTFSFSTQDAGRELKMSFRRESWRRFQVSVYVFHALDGDTISSPVGVYGYTAVYHPLLRWWRVESDT